jgi:uncharacterized membrane protein (UPF0127 family)
VAAVALALVFALVGGGLLAVDAGVFSPGSYDDATVTVTDENGTRLATVDVRVADTFQKRYTGLSDTASLADGEGMLFVHDRAGRHAYVMRDMAFPLDILFVGPNGTVTTVHHAELPPPNTPDEELERYRGDGRYVLEVPYGYTNRTGITVGDTVEIDGLD